MRSIPGSASSADPGARSFARRGCEIKHWQLRSDRRYPSKLFNTTPPAASARQARRQAAQSRTLAWQYVQAPGLPRVPGRLRGCGSAGRSAVRCGVALRMDRPRCKLRGAPCRDGRLRQSNEENYEEFSMNCLRPCLTGAVASWCASPRASWRAAPSFPVTRATATARSPRSGCRCSRATCWRRPTSRSTDHRRTDHRHVQGGAAADWRRHQLREGGNEGQSAFPGDNPASVPEYRLGPGDIISIIVWDHPN
jgi:hypothetical protein